MADIVDIAQAQEELFRLSALSRLQGVSSSAEVDTDTPRHCDDCDDLIPVARVKAVPHCSRCVLCQERAERGDR